MPTQRCLSFFNHFPVYSVLSNNFPLIYRATKIVLRGDSASQLMEMENEAKRMELPCYLVIDAGRTQVIL